MIVYINNKCLVRLIPIPLGLNFLNQIRQKCNWNQIKPTNSFRIGAPSFTSDMPVQHLM